MLMGELQEAEFQYGNNLKTHLIHVEQLIGSIFAFVTANGKNTNFSCRFSSQLRTTTSINIRKRQATTPGYLL